MDIIIIGLLVCLAIATTIVLLVAVPGLRAEGRLRSSRKENERFRLPYTWTGYDASGYFDVDEETAHLATREQAAVTVMKEHSYVLSPQPARHRVPSALTFRPRTRHWAVPDNGGQGFLAGLRLVLGRRS
ncbi:hypothetical protein [Sediminivirga luteola]|uniref:Uncharacterized protein n=1 Tax=Sediminivirga luteola TaxID=1774748 RepID=A0A8J2TV71_9MICO|nr:hypothetical protein [Sediminivirga luteola]MCI2264590.1 hypothetical protein [Sediminivirga luteola]GGA03174.1 hypothetical protein GCM10011333_02300 [Sediminivirga luteola]